MKLTIDRATWAFGKGDNNTFLLHRDGKKDVLGFFAKACGAHNHQLIYKRMLIKDGPFVHTYLSIDELASVPKTVKRVTDSILFYLADMNDKPGIKNEDRELLIKEGFEKIGVKAQFTGEYTT